MTESGLWIESRRSPSHILRNYLEQGRWQRYALDNQRQLVCCRLSWQKAIDPFSLLDAPGQSWRFFWRGREQLSTVVGLGQVLSSQDCRQPLLERTGQETWFVGLPFFSAWPSFQRSEQPSWGGLAAGFSILPEVEWQITDKGSELTVRTVHQADADAEQIALKMASVLRDYLPLTLRKSSAELLTPKLVCDEPDFASWQNMVEEAIHYIRQGAFSKVVLSRTKVLEFAQSLELAPILQRLSQLAEKSYLFAVKAPDGSSFVGRSPERLLSWNATNYFVDAIAGTRARAESRRVDFSEANHLRSSTKDLVEHRFVSDYVEEILQRYTTHAERVEQESLLRLQNVQHIRTQFRGVRNLEKSPFDLLLELHPTPAVGGYPKESSAEFIGSREPMARGLFTGAFGLARGQMEGDLAIGIRSALMHQKQLRLFAGAGIVEGSDPEWEWQETEVKMKNFTDLFLDSKSL